MRRSSDLDTASGAQIPQRGINGFTEYCSFEAYFRATCTMWFLTYT